MSTRIIGRFIALASVAAVALTGMPATSAAADTTPPVLTSVAISPASVVPGDTIRVSLAATDDVAVVRATVWLIEENTKRSTSAGSVTPSEVDLVVRDTWANGTYRVSRVSLEDAAGNAANYHLDGTYTSSPSTGQTTHELDLHSDSVTVSNATDRTPPTLVSFARTEAATRAGEPSTYRFEATAALGGEVAIQAFWRNDLTQESARSSNVRVPSGTGTLTMVLPYAGPWILTSVIVEDEYDNYALYSVRGVISTGGTSATTPHALNLSALAMQLSPGTQNVEVIPRPGRLTLVRVGHPRDSDVLDGFRVAVQPAGIVRDLSMAELSTGTLDLSGLANGVAQTVTFTARSAWGNSPTKTLTRRPVLSGNVTGVADVTGDRKPDVLAQSQYLGNPGLPVFSYPGTGTGGLRASTVYLAAGLFGCEQLGPMDVYILGAGEALCQNDDLQAMNRGGGGQIIGTRGWRAMSWVDGGYSLNADAYPDVVAMNPKGELLVYPMTSTGRALAPKRIGTGWGSMISVVSAGDLTGDRRNDIAAVDASGRLWLYPGNGTGGVTARRQIGSGWQNMAALLPLRDLSGDGKADLGGITPSGELRLYRGTGTGGVQPGVVIGTGWQRFL